MFGCSQVADTTSFLWHLFSLIAKVAIWAVPYRKKPMLGATGNDCAICQQTCNHEHERMGDFQLHWALEFKKGKI
jgi:hypothetical protein